MMNNTTVRRGIEGTVTHLHGPNAQSFAEFLRIDGDVDTVRVTVVIDGIPGKGMNAYMSERYADEIAERLKGAGWTDGGRSAWCACCCN
jgi:hypothetical protein